MDSAPGKRRIQSYDVVEILYEDASELLYKGESLGGRSVALKAYKISPGGISAEEALSSEGLFLKEAGVAGLPLFIEIIHEGGVPFLVFELPVGEALDAVIKGNPPLAERFEIAIALAEFIERLHEKRWLLLDINFRKIIWDRAAEKVSIVDSSAIMRKAKDGIVAKQVPRGVAYCSPEQTGRFNRPIDERSDVYVLGMATYHVLTGHPPVDPADVMKSIHFQMAFSLPRLNLTNVALSGALDLLLAKMTAKAKDQRYQSVEGARSDIQLIYQKKDHNEELAKIVLGAGDYANELIISQELYGRSFEIDALKARLAFVDRGKFELVFLHGQPGIGKSSVIKEFLSQIDVDRYVIASGKYRLLEQNEFLKGVISACEQIIRRKSLGDEVEFARWSQNIVDEIGDNWDLLANILPSLSTVAKSKTTDSNLSAAERRARVLQALYAFLKGSATAKNPVILFFDDIQWFDQGSRDVVAKLSTEGTAAHIFLICSYRTDDVISGNEVDYLLKGLKKANTPFTELTLLAIDNLQVSALVCDTLNPVAGNVDELVHIIQSKTGGNPFFVKQLLYHIFEEGILRRNSAHCWTWEAEAILSLKAASNVIELLEGRISQLQPDFHRLLLRVSCFDGRFSRTQLATWFDYSETFLGTALGILESENYIYSDKENNYFIFHDRIREAAYGMLSREEKREVHETIGHKIFEQYEKQQSRDLLIKSISHLNKAFDTSWPFEARLRLAEQNREAAQVSKAASAFAIAKNYAEAGMNALSPQELVGRVDLQFDLKTIMAECVYLGGNLQIAAQLFAELEILKVDIDKKNAMYHIYYEYLLIAGNYQESLKLGRKALAQIGITYPKKITKLWILFNFVLAEWQLKKIGVANLPSHRPLTNNRIKFAIRSFLMIGTAGYFVPSERAMFPYMVTKVFYYVLKFGGNATGASDGVLYSVIRAHLFNKFQSSYELAKACDTLMLNYGGTPFFDEGSFMMGGMMLPWVRPASEAKAMLEKTYLQGRRLGGLVTSNYCALYHGQLIYQVGEDLEFVTSETQKWAQEIFKSGHLNMYDCLLPVLFATSRLRGVDADLVLSEVGDGATLSESVDRINKSDFINCRAWFAVDSIIVDSIFRDRAAIEANLAMAELSLEATPFAFNILIVHFFTSLYRFDELRAGRGDKKLFQKKLKVSEKKLRTWQVSNPVTFNTFWFLFLAEKHVEQGDLANAEAAYFESIESAVAADNIMLEALSNERFGRFLLSQNKKSTGYKFLAASVDCYAKWKAAAKVKQLKDEFPALNIEKKVEQETRLASTSEDLDVFAVVKSCQIIGNEMDLSKLLQQIVFLLIENAGAEKGHVFIKTHDGLMLKATSLGVTEEDVRIVNTKLEAVDTVSKSLVKFVAKSLEPVVIDDAQTHELVSHDAYVKMAGCRSLLAMPITNKGQLIGVIWLENNSATGVFSEKKRIEILQILASQASISFENARLFGQEQEKMRMEGELRVAQTVQNTLFEDADGAIADFKISGSIEPASECGGDWWHYGSFGDINYFCIGDATGHGVSAALVTSAVRSAMATMGYVSDLSAAKMMDVLNNSVAQTSKGRINMTMFLAVYDKQTGEFTYCNNSHEPTLHIGGAWLEGLRLLAKTDRIGAIKKFRNELIFLSDVTGPALGAHAKIDFQSATYKISPSDYLFCYTDGIPEMYDAKDSMLGERHFLQLLAEAFIDETDIAKVRNSLRVKLKQFRGDAPLRDDVTFFLAKQDALVL